MPWENLSEDLQDLFEQSHEGNSRGDVAHLSYRERTDAKLRIINPNGAPDPTRWRRYWQSLKADPERYAKYLARNAANKKKWLEENRDKIRAYDRKYRAKPGRKEYMRKWGDRPDVKKKHYEGEPARRRARETWRRHADKYNAKKRDTWRRNADEYNAKRREAYRLKKLAREAP